MSLPIRFIPAFVGDVDALLAKANEGPVVSTKT